MLGLIPLRVLSRYCAEKLPAEEENRSDSSLEFISERLKIRSYCKSLSFSTKTHVFFTLCGDDDDGVDGDDLDDDGGDDDDDGGDDDDDDGDDDQATVNWGLYGDTRSQLGGAWKHFA